MRTYELRTYILSSSEALDSYRTVNYLRHLPSFAHHNIGPHGLWIGDCKNNGVTPIKEDALDDGHDARAGRGPGRARR